MATSCPCALSWSWDVTREKKKLAVRIDVVTFLYFEFVTPFGTIREHRDGPDERELPSLEPCSENIEFALDDNPISPPDSDVVPSRIAEALSNLRIESSSNPVIYDVLRQNITDVVLNVLRHYTETYDTETYGSVVCFGVEAEKVITFHVGENAKAFFERYVEIETCDISSEDACAICLDDFLVGEEVARTGCGHSFHLRCIGQWLCNSLSCPMCRTPLE